MGINPHLPQQCLDAAKVLEDAGAFETCQSVLREAAEQINKLKRMAYQPPHRHEEGCNCLQCVPF